MASYVPSHDCSTSIHSSPSLVNHGFPVLSTPLVLPHDWLECNDCCTSGDFDFDFQSNYRDLAPTRPAIGSFSLTGLGIRNIGLASDLDALQCNLPEVADTNGPTFCPDLDLCHDDLHLFSIDPFENGRGVTDGMRVYDRLGMFTAVDSPWISASNRDTSTGLQDATLDPANPDTEYSVNINPASDGPSPCADIDTYGIGLSLEEISAGTGLSVTDFAAQISATAEATLRTMAQEGIGCDEFREEVADDPLNFQSNSSVTHWLVPDLLLPSTGENFHNPSVWSACHGVNPAEIFPIQSPSLNYSIPSPTPLSFLDTWDGDDNLTKSICDDTSLVSKAEPAPEHDVLFPSHASHQNRQLSDDEQSLFQSPSSSEYSPSLRPPGVKRALAPNFNRRRVARSRVQDDHVFQTPDPLSHCVESALPPINLGTPVFDAHRGIDIEVLKAKAERYRLRNQGREYDKRWLISFAGKLSPKGELVDEFRCYIAGCKQTNKRRDHILIHVGAHLDQRPFKCMYCSSRFLRKNECKRHELSHTGLRPFSCHLCPYPSTTFVRQDLLKRHMKRTHRMPLKSDKENETPDRPKKRARC